MTEDLEDARLTVVAIVRAIRRDDTEAYNLLLNTTPDLCTLAQAACAMVDAMLRALPEDVVEEALGTFTLEPPTGGGEAAATGLVFPGEMAAMTQLAGFPYTQGLPVTQVRNAPVAQPSRQGVTSLEIGLGSRREISTRKKRNSVPLSMLSDPPATLMVLRLAPGATWPGGITPAASVPGLSGPTPNEHPASRALP